MHVCMYVFCCQYVIIWFSSWYFIHVHYILCSYLPPPLPCSPSSSHFSISSSYIILLLFSCLDLYMWENACDAFISESDLFCVLYYAQVPPIFLQMRILLLWLIKSMAEYNCAYIPPFLHLLICLWASRLSCFLKLWIVLQGSWMYRYLCFMVI